MALLLMTGMWMAGCATDPQARTVPPDWHWRDGVYHRGTITDPAGAAPRDGLHMPGGVHRWEVERLFDMEPMDEAPAPES